MSAEKSRSEEVKILLVEDDEVSRIRVRRCFKELKIVNPLFYACDGVEAFAILRGEGCEQLERPYIILLDLNMPRMDGIEFLEELRKDPELHNTIVFVLTSSDAEEDKVKAYEKNIAGFIVKSKIKNRIGDVMTMLNGYRRVVDFP